ncbi:hypothetical protein BURK2_02679 [Burkholderiales bacterium]|nr:MAG: hypothetical protein F9K47_12310 [Burkholderiales bacterium]CAG0995995.1 hypothetical protein BURK2_02679 [Burkholderiales bacterium]
MSPSMAQGGIPLESVRTAMNLYDSIDDADFVQFDGLVFQTEYRRAPDEYTLADDVLLEARLGDMEIALTRSDLDDAAYEGDGVYRLKAGNLMRLLATATVH